VGSVNEKQHNDRYYDRKTRRQMLADDPTAQGEGKHLPRGKNDDETVASSIETSVCGSAVGGTCRRGSFLTTGEPLGLGRHREKPIE